MPIITPPPPIQPFPRPEILVNCLADGVNVQLDIEDKTFHGIMYVKGHSHNPNCRRTVDPVDTAELIDFDVKFDTCGLFHYNVSLSDKYGLKTSYRKVICSYFYTLRDLSANID